MQISNNSPGTNSNPLTSSAEAIPASRSAKPASAAEPTTPGIFGRSSQESFAYFDPDSYCWKTSQGTFLSGLEVFSEIFPDSGTMRTGCVYALRTSGRATSGSGCSSSHTWNTPSTEDHKSDGPIALGRYERGEAMTCDMRLRNQAITWPSPRSEDSESAGNHPGAVDSLTGATRNWLTPHGMHGTDHMGKTGRGGEFAKQVTNWRTPDAPGTGGPRNRQGSRDAGHQITIAEQAELWQTLATDSFRSRGGDWKDEMGLDQQARMFPMESARPTPRASDKSGESSVRVMDRTKRFQLREAVMMRHSFSLPAPQTLDGQQLSESTPGSRRPSRRRLNGEFVTWLMGFPAWWTDVD